jgi:tetratricopeptide (TPR) repeat protein
MEEMKQAWEYYVQKDKSKFKPQFAFDDLAIFDRALYNKISNPLVLRLFLETYQGKNLPKKGNQHLDIWSDWLTSFSEEEQAFFTALANAIWEKGENELLLDDVLKDNTLLPYFTNDQLNSPYPRLRNLGWISRYVKDLNACIGFAVEGALLHLLGKKLNKQELTIGLAEIKQLLQTGSPLQQAGVGAYLQQLALKGDLNMVCEVIDAGEEFIEACVTPIVLHLKTIGVKETLDILLQNPTENDWRALLKVDEVLIKLTLHPLRKELAIAVLPKNEFSSKASIQLGLREIRLIQKAEGELYLSKINLEESKYLDDAQICSSLGHVIKEYGNNDKALEWYHKCLDILLKTLGTEHSYVASTYDNIGLVYNSKGEYDKALEWYQKCLDIKLTTLGAGHPSVATTYNNIGVAWKNKGEYDKALEWYQECLEIQLKKLGALHPSVATSFNKIGGVYRNKGEYDKALEWYEKGLDIRLKTLGAEHPSVATSYNNIGLLCDNKGEYDKALEWYQKSLDIYLKTLGAEHPSVATSYNNIGAVCDSKGEYNKALEWYQKGLDIQLKTLGAEHPSVTTSYFNIGSVCANKGDYDKALEWYHKGLDIQLKTLGAEHPNVAISHYNLGSVHHNTGQYDKALAFYQLSMDILLKTMGNKDPAMATFYFEIGDCQKELQMYQEAIDSFKSGYEIEKLGGFPFYIGLCYEELAENENALQYYIQSAEIRKEDPDLGLVADSTQEAIAAAKRLAKELGKEDELPKWMKNDNQ